MSHKRNFQDYIEPNYKFVQDVNPSELRAKFQTFHSECLKAIPDEGKPEDPYMFNAHMGAFCRRLDEAKDEYVKGMLAFYAARNSGSDTN